MNQKQVWENISDEWNEFKTEPEWHVIDFLKDKTGNILDLGSGSGRHLMKIKNGKMFLVDFSKKMIELAKKKAKEKKISAEFFTSPMHKLPFKDNFFDNAICIASLHCVEGEEEREEVIKELFRVLKKGGELEVLVWNKNAPRFKNAPKEKLVKWRDKGERYYYLYDEKEIYNLFEKIGFQIIKTYEAKRQIKFIAKKV
jgi:ubiquinone/menaquinone biosynthesis C-methylase UbiE